MFGWNSCAWLLLFAELKVLFFNPDQAKDRSQFVDPTSGAEYEVVDNTPLVEWFANHYKDFGATLEFVTNRYPLVVACVCVWGVRCCFLDSYCSLLFCLSIPLLTSTFLFLWC